MKLHLNLLILIFITSYAAHAEERMTCSQENVNHHIYIRETAQENNLLNTPFSLLHNIFGSNNIFTPQRKYEGSWHSNLLGKIKAVFQPLFYSQRPIHIDEQFIFSPNDKQEIIPQVLPSSRQDNVYLRESTLFESDNISTPQQKYEGSCLYNLLGKIKVAFQPLFYNQRPIHMDEIIFSNDKHGLIPQVIKDKVKSEAKFAVESLFFISPLFVADINEISTLNYPVIAAKIFCEGLNKLSPVILSALTDRSQEIAEKYKLTPKKAPEARRKAKLIQETDLAWRLITQLPLKTKQTHRSNAHPTLRDFLQSFGESSLLY